MLFISITKPFIHDYRMTLGNVYDMDLKRNESTIKEVITQAQGEVMIFATLAFRLFLTGNADGARGIY